MAEGYVRKLLNSGTRMGILRTMPICTGDERKALLQNKAKDDPITGNRLLDYFHVDKADRICYFDLRRAAFPWFEASYLNLCLEDTLVSAQYKSDDEWKTLRPCFYLPYVLNSTTRMKLSEPTTYNGPPVRFFATAAIDGCSVYIEGPAATPKVTHANAQNVRPTTATDTWKKKRSKIRTKIQTMDTRYEHLQKQNATVVERTDYIIDKPSRQTRAQADFARRIGIPATQVTSYQPFGTVVGFKDGNSWKFYMQKCAQFDYTRTPGGANKAQYVVLSACEIWPNGGGVFRTL